MDATTFTVPLDGVDLVRWSTLRTAFGTAEDLPRALRLCASCDAATAVEAAHEVGQAIFHQGSLYPASAVALPFVITLLEDRRILSRDALTGYLEAMLRSATSRLADS